MKIITINFGFKDLRLARSYYNAVVFSCYDNDVKTAYRALAENIMLKDHAYQTIFEILKCDKDVKTFLDDAKQQGFIEEYKID